MSEMLLPRDAAETYLTTYLGRPVSLLRRDRRGGLEAIETPEGLRWRLPDLKAWADGKRITSSLDTRGTKLGDWMHNHRKTVWGFAHELGIDQRALAALVGRAWKKKPLMPRSDVLTMISLATGIPERTLVADAVRVSQGGSNGRT